VRDTTLDRRGHGHHRWSHDWQRGGPIPVAKTGLKWSHARGKRQLSTCTRDHAQSGSIVAPRTVTADQYRQQPRDSSGLCGWSVRNRAAEPLVVARIRPDRERRLLVHQWLAATRAVKAGRRPPEGEALTARSAGAPQWIGKPARASSLAGRRCRSRRPRADSDVSQRRSAVSGQSSSTGTPPTHTNPRRTTEGAVI
jgi:hypothetical protein